MYTESLLWTNQHNNIQQHPWDDEPDFVYFKHKETGLNYFIRRTPEIGILCGYVIVGKKALELLNLTKDSFDVHGGITFFDKFYIQEVGFSGYAIGFDCGHSGDLVPGISNDPDLMSSYTYRDLKYVQNECKKLAKQVADALENIKLKT